MTDNMVKVREAMEAEIVLLRSWARESKKGGWSTHQVDPMRRRADELEALFAPEPQADTIGELDYSRRRTELRAILLEVFEQRKSVRQGIDAIFAIEPAPAAQGEELTIIKAALGHGEKVYNKLRQIKIDGAQGLYELFCKALDCLDIIAFRPQPKESAKDEASGELAKLIALIDKAHDKVVALCHGERWIMHVPAQPDSDPDLVIGEALRQAKKALIASHPAPADEEALRAKADAYLADVSNGSALGLYTILFHDDPTEEDLEWARKQAASLEGSK